MPILPDATLDFSIEGDSYEYESFDTKKGWVKKAGVFGPEYAGTFSCRYRSVNDESEIQNGYHLRFMAGTQGVRARHLDMVMGLLTLQQVAVRTKGSDEIKGVPAWFAFDKLGTELDETAVIHALDKYREKMEGAKKD